MTIWVPSLAGRSGPRYAAIADAISDAVKAGDLQDGCRLPPQRELAVRLGLTLSTITRAYALAKQRGYVSGEVGRGTFIRDPRSVSSFAFGADGDQGQIDLTCFRPAPCNQEAAIGAACDALARRLSPAIVQRYPPAAGFTSARQIGALWMRRSALEVDPRQVIVCGGAQQALANALAAMTAPGDVVLTEALTYSGLRELASLFRLRLEGLAMDEQGLLPEALEAASASGARVVYLQPTLHNPTTAVMSLQRREEIAAVARRRDLILIEDDVCGALLQDRPAALASLAPERTCFVTSTSKCLAPSLRVGFLAVPHDMVGRMAATQHTLTLAAAPIMPEILAVMLEDGSADRIVAQQRAESERRHAMACQILSQHDFRAHPSAFSLWLALPPPWRADEYAAAARIRGVAVVPAENFYVGRGAAPPAVRIALSSAPTADMLGRGLALLSDLLGSHHQPRGSVI